MKRIAKIWAVCVIIVMVAVMLTMTIFAEEITKPEFSIILVDENDTEVVTFDLKNIAYEYGLYNEVYDVKEISIIPDMNMDEVKMSLNGKELISGEKSETITLVEGKNTIDLEIDINGVKSSCSIVLNKLAADYVNINMVVYSDNSYLEYVAITNSTSNNELEFNVDGSKVMFVCNKNGNYTSVKINGEILSNKNVSSSNETVISKGINVFNVEITTGEWTKRYTLNVIVPGGNEWSNPFNDVSIDSWFYNAVQYCNENSLMNGTSETEFNPAGTGTRAMVVTILYRMMGEPEVNIANPFIDVEEGSWYYNAVHWAAENGIVNGYGEGKFGPNDNITREQFITVLYRFANKLGKEMKSSEKLNMEYVDITDVSDYAITPVYWGLYRENGIMLSRSKDTLEPKSSATRAEIAYGMANFSRNIMN